MKRLLLAKLASFVAIGLIAFGLSQMAVAHPNGITFAHNCNLNTPRCALWMRGVTIGIEAGQEMQRAGYRVCLPHDMTGPQLYLVVRKFMADHPEDLNERPAALIAHALHHYYACR